MDVRRWAWLAFWTFASLPLIDFAWIAHRDHLQLASALRALRHAHSVSGIDPRTLPRAAPREMEWLGQAQNDRIKELSGLAASRLRDDLLFAVNDSGDSATLYALGVHGEDRGSIEVRGAQNVDWEDLAAFESGGVAYLLIADVGDNFAWRPAVTLYVVREPVLTGERFAPGASVTPTWILRVRYPDGPRDCESVAVDADSRQILLLSKRTQPPTLYAVPLAPRHDDPRAPEATLVAQRLTAVPIPRRSAHDSDPDAEYPTALDIARDGSQAFVLTYSHGYFFTRAPGEAWSAAFARLPQRFHPWHLPAQEAAAYARDGRTVFISTEGAHPPIVRIGPPAGP